MSTLNRIACLRTLQEEWDAMPEGKPEQRERWFQMVGTEIAALPTDRERARWIWLFADTLHRKQCDLPMSVCIFIIEERVKAAQNGVAMHKPNVKVHRLAASGTAEEYFGGMANVSAETLDFEPDPLGVDAQDRRFDYGVTAAAIGLGTVILGLAFWPAILDWMTPFKYGVVAGAVGMAALLIGLLVIGVCLGAGRLENAKR